MAGLGQNPQQIPNPNPYGDLSTVLPTLGSLNTTAGGDVLSKLQGNLSPSTVASLQNYGATYAANNGMPGTSAQPGTLPFDTALRSLGLNEENQIQQGLQDYSSLIPTISSTQTVNPALETEIASTNAINSAAPNPTDVAQYEEGLFNRGLYQNPAGGTGTRLLGPKAGGEGTQPQYSFAPAGFGAASTAPIFGYGPPGQTNIGGVPTSDNSKPYSFEQWLQDTFGPQNPAGGVDPEAGVVAGNNFNLGNSGGFSGE